MTIKICEYCGKKYSKHDYMDYSPYCPNCKIKINKKKGKIKIIVYILLFISCLLILGNIVNAESNIQTLGSIKPGDTILLKQNCVNVTFVNITSISVSGVETRELLSSSIQMNRISNGYQNYNFSNTTIIGTYIVTGICDENGQNKTWSYDFTTKTFSLPEVITYIFFILVLGLVFFFSFRLIQTNKLSKDMGILKGKDTYELKKRNEFLFYVNILKQKLWIVGLFGIYISGYLFIIFLNQLTVNLGMYDVQKIMMYLTIVLSWGFIPFIVFWIGYLVIFFSKSIKDTMMWEYGNITNSFGGRKR